MHSDFPNKRAQIQIMQTVIIIIVVFIILFIGFLFYMNYSSKSAEQEIMKMDEKKSILAASYVLSIPEISCSQKLDIKQNCFDASKMIVFNASKNIEYYSDFFYNSIITVKIFYGNQSSGICRRTPNNFPKCDEFLIYENPLQDYENTDTYYMPVSVFDPFLDAYYAAYVKMTVFT